MIKFLALCLIRFYQRFISPYKGFSCAYRVHTGKASCSQLGYRAIRRHGLIGGVRVLRGRLACCSEAYHEHHQSSQSSHAQTHRPAGSLRAQGGFVDCGGCDVIPCDFGGSGAKGVSNAARGASECIDPCTVLDCGGCGGERKRSRDKK